MPLFEHETPETLKARVLERIGTDLQTREGSYTYDTVAPMAFELWRWAMTLEELICAFYVDENSGGYLDDHAKLLGLARKLGTRAYATVHFTGKDGTQISAGTAFFTPTGEEFRLVYDVVLKDDGGTGYLQAAEVGSRYNADGGEISRILRNIYGLESWLSEPALGGTDPEEDKALFARIDQKRKHPSTSGNESHYREWALEVDGVGDCKVQKLWKGPGTVRVLLVDYDRQPVDEAVRSACCDHIQTKRPVGADVTVESARGAPISVTAKVVLKKNAVLAEVEADFVSKLDTYLRSIAFQIGTVRVNQVSALLMAVPGVLDYTEVLVNGGEENIVLPDTDVPVLGEVRVL